VGIILVSLSYLQQQSSASFFDNLLGSPYKTYSNETYHVKIDYPKDWNYEHLGYDKDFPETIYKILFYFPDSDSSLLGSVSITIDELNPVVSLVQYKDRIVKNLNDAGEDTAKDITVTATTMNGEPAYRLEHMVWMLDHWDKSIDIYSIKNGKLYDISALATPEGMNKYAEQIKKMFESVKFQ
jgi:hypothetical protein